MGQLRVVPLKFQATKKVLAQGQLGVIPTKILFEATLRVGLVKPRGNLLLPYFQTFWANLGIGPGVVPS